MYTIHKDERVYLVDKNNNYKEFKSYKDFIADRYKRAHWPYNYNRRYFFIKRDIPKELSQDIGNNWNDTYRYFEPIKPGSWIGTTELRTVDFILFDANFRVIPSAQIRKDLDKYKVKKYTKRNRFKNYEWLGFRNGPVSGVCKKRWRFKSYYRRPKTTQERRLSFYDKEYIRGSRSAINLPNTYDDVRRSSNDSKCWKDCTKKRKQWL